MTRELSFYVAAYLAATSVGVWLLVRQRHTITLLSAAYGRYLLVPWKLSTFAIAFVGLVAIAPYTGDPTWDYVDATFMSLLTFATAPWATGTLYLFVRGQARAAHAYVAAIVWLLTASWSYDLYILLRDGSYPITWFSNLFASSVLYVSGGLMWNLEWRPARGATFGFLEPAWPQAEALETGFLRIAGYAAPFMLIVAAGVLFFFW